MEEASRREGRRKRAKRGQFWRGLVFWAVAGLFLVLSMLWAAYQWRVPLANWYLAEQLGLRAGIGGHRGLAHGAGEVDGIWLDLGEEMGVAIEIAQVGWVASAAGLASGELAELRFGGPKVRVDLGAGVLAGEGLGPADGGVGEGGVITVEGAELAVVDARGGELPRWLMDMAPRVGKIAVEGGELEIQLPAGQGLVRARFELAGRMAGLSREGKLLIEEQAVTVRDVEWESGAGGEGGAQRLVDSVEFVLATGEDGIGRWEVKELTIRSAELEVGPGLLDAVVALADWAGQRGDGGGGEGGLPALSVGVATLEIGRLAVGGFAGGHSLLPMAVIPELEVAVRGEIEAIEVGADGGVAWGRAGVQLDELGLGLAGELGGFRVRRLAVELMEGREEGELVRLERLAIDGLEVDWTRGLAAAFGGGGARESVVVGDGGGGQGRVWFGEVEITDGEGRIEVGEDQVVSLGFGVSGRGFRMGADGIGGTGEVRLDLADLRWGGGGGWDDEGEVGRRARADRVRIEFIPDEFFGERRRIARLAVDAPEIELDLARWVGQESGGQVVMEGDVADQEVGAGGLGWWSGADVGEISIGGGAFSVRDSGRGLPTVRGEWSVSSLPAEGEEPPWALPERPHELVLMGVEVKADVSEEALVRLPEARVVVRASEIWGRKRIDRIVVRGIEATIDELAMGLIGELAADGGGGQGGVGPGGETEDPGHEGWWAGSVHIEGGRVELDRVVPGIDEVLLGVESHLSEVPLGASAFKLANVPQRVELKGLKIRSPYVATATVADLPVVFVEFSVGGLSERRIDKVEIISPSVFVGEHLFWYIDYYREQSRGRTTGGNEEELGADEEGGAGKQGWDVVEVEVSGGKLYVAPKGVVLSWFPYPFPFEVHTEFAKGTLESSFVIPRKTYRILPFEIEVEDLRGEVQFNLPFRTVDSNLVETLQASVLRWRKFEAREVYLTLTYDALGIYGRFGGEFYGEGSYVEGGFNVYLEESTPWDAWASASDVELLPITKILTPEYVVIDGRFDASIIGTGTLEELYQARGELTAKKPGSFEVLHFDKILEDLPPEWSPLQERLARAGIEALRDFHYETAEGVFRGYRQEGYVELDLRGPTGRRLIEIRVNDHPGPAPERSIGSVEEGEPDE